MRILTIAARHYRFHEPFVISRESINGADVLEVSIRHGNAVGHGESYGVTYAGETVATMRAQIEAVGNAIEAGCSRTVLLDLMPPGGARFAVDSALWDLEAKQGGLDPFAANGFAAAPVVSARTIGIRDLAGYEEAGSRNANATILKVKVAASDPHAAVAAVRRGAPDVALIVDPNQAWSIAELKALAPRMADLGVVLLEQPIPVGAEAGLDGYACPVSLCADELLNGVGDLDKIAGRFQVANIKLDKTGGLTAALRLADAAVARGLGLMVGCMGGSSLNMAPAMVLAQRCRFVDLDGPLFLSADREPGFVYRDGRIERPHDPAIWG